MVTRTRLWIIISGPIIALISTWIFVWNTSSSISDVDPPPVVHRDPPEGVETKSKRHPPETIIIKNVTNEVKGGFVNLTD